MVVEHTHIYERPEKKRPSFVTALTRDMADLKKAGRNLFDLGAGKLVDTPTEEEKQAWLSQLEDEEVEDRAVESQRFQVAAAAVFAKDTAMAGVGEEHIALGNGASGALRAVFSTLGEGDKLIVSSPGWSMNYDLPPPGVKIITVNSDERGLIPPDDMKEVLKQHPDVKAILVSEPSNPTGEKYTAEEREAVFGAICEHEGKPLVVKNDPYGKLVLDGSDQIVGENEAALFENKQMAVVRTLTKEYGLPGLRVGYVATKAPDVLDAVHQAYAQTPDVPTAAKVRLARAAIVHGAGFVERTIADLKEKRKILVDGVAALEGATMEPPKGALYGWVDMSFLKGKRVEEGKSLDGGAFGVNSPRELRKFLLEVAGISHVPGGVFYSPNTSESMESWKVRLCYSGDKNELKQGLDNVRIAVEALRDPPEHVPIRLQNGGINGAVR